LKLSATVTSIARGADFEVCFSQSGRGEILQAAAIVLATPAYTASQLVASLSSVSSPKLSHTLSGVAYAPVAVVASGYYNHQIGQELTGFGFLVPRNEKVRTLGTVWNSSLFPGRAPAGNAALTSFIGGATDPRAVDLPDEEIAGIVHGENARILGITGPPNTSVVWKHAKALPQYNMGHGHIVEAIRDGEKLNPGLFFCGNYLEGPSLGKCVETSSQTALAIQTYLQLPR
jgi:protoporphyrinogen/coproporphyrinogen III oxidase